MKLTLGCLLLVLAVMQPIQGLGVLHHSIKPVSVFRPEEIVYHKYAAVLAAVEPFRLQYERDIQEIVGPIEYSIRRLFESFSNWPVLGGLSKPISEWRNENGDIDAACLRYEKRVDDIVKSYGLSVDWFNALSNLVSRDSSLKQRVLLQSYYYRIAADLETNIRENLPVLPTISVSSRLLKFSPVDDGSGSAVYLPSAQYEPQLTRFCKSLRSIEYERLKQRQSLQESLGVSHLPERMCDPDVFPAMSKELQHACVDFRKVAASIISSHDLTADEFNALQEKTKKNFVFQMKVKKEMQKLERQVRDESRQLQKQATS